MSLIVGFASRQFDHTHYDQASVETTEDQLTPTEPYASDTRRDCRQLKHSLDIHFHIPGSGKRELTIMFGSRMFDKPSRWALTSVRDGGYQGRMVEAERFLPRERGEICPERSALFDQSW